MTRAWLHYLAHVMGWNCVQVLREEADGWITRECATCHQVYRPAPPMWPL